MRNGFKIFVFILTAFFQVWAEGSLVGYKTDRFSLKLTAQALQDIRGQNLQIGLTGIAEIDRLNQQYSVRKLTPLFQHETRPEAVELNQWFTVYLPKSETLESIVKQYDALPSVLVAERIPIHEVYAMPDDPKISNQWHLDQSNDADLDAPEAWDVGGGNPAIIVTVMDTGVEWFHHDLGGALASQSDRESIRGNIWINQAELGDTTSTLDEDGNGYADDWVGWDFVTGSPNLLNLGDDYDTADNDPRDSNGHGTHCSGNVSAINNNGVGVCSAAGGWGEDVNGNGNGVKVMALRIGWDDFPSGRVSMDFAAQAFQYAAENGARIASCSWGSSETSALNDAVNIFLYDTATPAAGAPVKRLIFVAAGNSGNENNDYLTGREDIIAVAATQEDDNAATEFTNYGAWVDISAPGNNIYSTAKNGGYVSYSGTSMATPITASVAALIWSYDPTLTAVQVRDYLYNGADNIDNHLDAKYIGKMGAGRVNAKNSLDLIAGASSVGHKAGQQPQTFALQQNYPNPFNPTTSIRYHVARQTNVQLIVYNMLGQKLKTMVNKTQPAGSYSIRLDASDLASGVYYYTFKAGSFTQTKKMLLVR